MKIENIKKLLKAFEKAEGSLQLGGEKAVRIEIARLQDYVLDTIAEDEKEQKKYTIEQIESLLKDVKLIYEMAIKLKKQVE